MDQQLLAQVFERQGETLAEIRHLKTLVTEQGKVNVRQDRRIRRLELRWTRMISVFTLIGSGITLTLNYVFRRET